MNKQAALEVFREYASLYDTDDIKIKLKIDHTYRVADIFRVLTEPPYDERNRKIVENSVDGTVAREDVMNCVREHRCVPRRSDFTPFEALISQCCMAFELEFPESVAIVREQGYLWQLTNVWQNAIILLKGGQKNEAGHNKS